MGIPMRPSANSSVHTTREHFPHTSSFLTPSLWQEMVAVKKFKVNNSQEGIPCSTYREIRSSLSSI